MNSTAALRLLGALGSQEVQRRYIVNASGDSYLLPSELIEDGHYFLAHPLLGETASLASVQQFSRILREVGPSLPLSDPTVSNRFLVEREPRWAKVREAARTVLQEMGADLGAWEHEQLSGSDARQ